MARYGTLADLKAAYDSGDLSKDDQLILDNDSTGVWTDAAGKVFDGGDPRTLLREALDLLGIPWDLC